MTNNDPLSAAGVDESLNLGTQMSQGVREMFERMQTSAFAGAEKFAEEGFRFWSRRMTAYADHLCELQGCKSAAELMTLNSTFLSRTLADYASEARSVVEMGQRQAAEAEKAASNDMIP